MSKAIEHEKAQDVDEEMSMSGPARRVMRKHLPSW